MKCTLSKKGVRYYTQNGKRVSNDEGCKTNMLCENKNTGKKVNNDGFVVDKSGNATKEILGKPCNMKRKKNDTSSIAIKKPSDRFIDVTISHDEMIKELNEYSFTKIKVIIHQFIKGSSTTRWFDDTPKELGGDGKFHNFTRSSSKEAFLRFAMKGRRMIFQEIAKNKKRIYMHIFYLSLAPNTLFFWDLDQ